MAEPTRGDAALAAMRALVDGFVRSGLTDACISPGSRSTPIALAAARDGRLRIHVHADERSSAFFALGAAKATGRPALVITTSGTAVANLLPGVVEASMSRTPLVALTADRPPELRGAGANQTIDQIGIFGGHVLSFVDAPVPEPVPEVGSVDPGGWRSLARAAFGQALGPPGGPVHLNLPFREPLVPGSSEPGARAESSAEPARTSTRRADAFGAESFAELAALVAGVERGLLLAGWTEPWTSEADLAAIEALAVATGWPLIAEPLSGLRRHPVALSAGQHLLMDEAFAAARVPRVVIQLGAAPTTRAAQAFLARAERLVVVSPAPADPEHRADEWFETSPGVAARRLLEHLGDRRPDHHGDASPWLRGWLEADRAVRIAVEGSLDTMDVPFEGRIARDVAAAAPAGSVLFAGSSMPVRDLDAYMEPRSGVRVVANRGASGIDGSVSTVLGLAAAADAPVIALMGDLALLHDAGALLWSGRAGPPTETRAVFVVPNNHGGGIFDHLAVASEPEHERLFVTPQSVPLDALAAAARADHHCIERPENLGQAVTDAAARGGVHLLEVPIDRATGIQARADVRSAVRAALESL
jgi:2-succinyl-5-enolpyruvyl-6-hydroxy-3-cyclohexene-1-carboxylate synthase